MIDFINAPLNGKMAMIIFGGATISGFLIRRSMKLIIGCIIAIIITVILFLITYKSGIFTSNEEIAKIIIERYYHAPIIKIKSLLDTFIHTPPANWHFLKILVLLVGFGFGFGFLGSYFGEPKIKK
jgi:hypothetical protein